MTRFREVDEQGHEGSRGGGWRHRKRQRRKSSRERWGKERDGQSKRGGGPVGGEVEKGSGGVREEKKGRESRKSMEPQDDARGLLPKMTWDTLEQVTGGVTTDFILHCRHHPPSPPPPHQIKTFYCDFPITFGQMF